MLINVSRALTRLKNSFVTLQKDYARNRAVLNGRMQWYDFFNSASLEHNDGSLTHRSQGESEFQLQVDPKLFLEYPIRSHNEAYHQVNQFKKTLGFKPLRHTTSTYLQRSTETAD